jgi:hypothetical protein
MVRTRLLGTVLVAAGLAWAGAAQAADEAKPPKSDPHGFYAKYLAPRMDSRLNAEFDAADLFATREANQWSRDDATVSRVQRGAIRATKSAVKRYAVESLGLNNWSLPLFRAHGGGIGALRTDSRGPRLTFGFSHMAPRAEVLIPVASGRVGFSADALGRVGVNFQTTATGLSFGASVDPRDHSGSFGLTSRF